MFARFDENPAMTLQDIKETKCYGWTHARPDAHTDGQRKNSIPTTKFAGGIIILFCLKIFFTFTNSVNPDEMQHYVAFHQDLYCL